MVIYIMKNHDVRYTYVCIKDLFTWFQEIL